MSKSIVAGAIGGLVASFAMNQFQSAVSAVSEARFKASHSPEDQPDADSKSSGDDATVEAAKALSTALFKHELSEDEKKWAGPAVHYGFGTVLGGLYGSLAPSTPVDVCAGAGYGAAVWLAADEIAVPLFGWSGPPQDTPLSGHAEALVSHLIFGIVTHFTRRLILR